MSPFEKAFQRVENHGTKKAKILPIDVSSLKTT